MSEAYGDLQRGVLLYEQRRYDLAVESLRKQLATTPDEPAAHTYLALSLHELERHDEALEVARTAVSLAPEDALAHWALGHALLAKRDRKGAVAASEQVVRLAPDSPAGYSLRSAAQFEGRRWADALASAEEGLHVDPTDEASQTLRGLALTQLGRRDEAQGTFSEVLRLNPENSYAHSSRGLTLLHERKHRDAMEAFREALRLDPTNENARAGLIEAMKGRNPIYAILLRWFLWSGRLGGRAMIALFVGWFLFNRTIRALMASPDTRLIGSVILGGWLLFVWSTFVASPLFNLILRLDPVGRYALSEEERTESTLVIPFLAVGLPAAVVAIVTGSSAALALAVAGLGGLVPLGVAFQARRGKLRTALLGVTVVVIAFGAAAAALELVNPGAPLVATLTSPALGLCALSTWASWGVAIRN